MLRLQETCRKQAVEIARDNSRKPLAGGALLDWQMFYRTKSQSQREVRAGGRGGGLPSCFLPISHLIICYVQVGAARFDRIHSPERDVDLNKNIIYHTHGGRCRPKQKCHVYIRRDVDLHRSIIHTERDVDLDKNVIHTQKYHTYIPGISFFFIS